jgi:hypothetical protein
VVINQAIECGGLLAAHQAKILSCSSPLDRHGIAPVLSLETPGAMLSNGKFLTLAEPFSKENIETKNIFAFR